MGMDVVDYKVYGAEMQFVEIELDPTEAAVGAAGSMVYMEDGITMETIFGDGSSQQKGFLDKMLGAGKRLLTGESLFTTVYTNAGSEKRKVAFGAPYPGKIVPINLEKVGGTFICQKDAFLCAAKGVSLGIAFQKKLGAGFFGDFDNFIYTEVAFGGGSGSDKVGFVGIANMEGGAVGGGKNSYGADAHLTASAHHSDGYFASIGNKNFFYHCGFL